MCQDEGTFWQFWWFLCRPESPFFVERDSSAISEEELRFHWHYTVHLCWKEANTVAGASTDAGMFVGKGQRTICNYTWGHFHTCSLLAWQWLATQTLAQKLSKYCVALFYFLPTASFMTDPHRNNVVIYLQYEWFDSSQESWLSLPPTTLLAIILLIQQAERFLIALFSITLQLYSIFYHITALQHFLSHYPDPFLGAPLNPLTMSGTLCQVARQIIIQRTHVSDI